MSESPILMTQAEYARHRNKSPQYIGKLYKAGILVMRRRLVDAAASDAVLDDKPDDAPADQQPTTFAQARLAREVFSAKLKKLEYETRIGKLVPTDEVSIKWYTLGHQTRDPVLGFASKRRSSEGSGVRALRTAAQNSAAFNITGVVIGA